MTRGKFWSIGGAGGPHKVRPPVYVGSGVTIDPSAVVGPYAVLGDNSTIGPAAHVRFAVLWDGVHVDIGARISEAILASNVRVGREAVVENGAVIGHDTTIEAGTVLEPDARVSSPSRVAEEVASKV
ncbi:MAG: NDP-sugar synthase [Candidatus Eremiobacteraeota bacterium]|nr:NDP-sugar synthase [Candidatus Eremiobacteraeota bacterium]